MISQTIDSLASNPIGIIILIVLGILAVLTVLMPVMIFQMHNDVRKILQIAKASQTQTLLDTKLLTEIRDALRSMEAVGIEVEQSTEPEYTAPPVFQSIGPRRHQLRQ
jgi:hypothetical protein